MTTYNCSAGHNSVDPDFCSECGNQLAPLPGASSPAGAPAADPASAPPASSSTSGHEDCPMCTEVRDGSAQFCGVCGYDFVNKTGGEVPQAAAPAPAAPAPNYAPPAVPTPTVAAPMPRAAPVTTATLVTAVASRRRMR